MTTRTKTRATKTKHKVALQSLLDTLQDIYSDYMDGGATEVDDTDLMFFADDASKVMDSILLEQED